MTTVAYFRFSDPNQDRGTSIRRQDEDCTTFCTRMGWTVDERIIDRGVSAFSGSNRQVGAGLGKFEQEAAAGLRHNTTLVVERIDRLSREGFDEARTLIRTLNDAGVTVAVVDGAEIYRPGERLDTGRLLTLVIKAELAREESAKKSQRLKRKYEIRREEARATGKVMTANLPAWLRKSADGRAEIVPGRDVVIRRIFELADSGMGGDRIVTVINAECEPWQGRNGQVASFWTRSRVGRILADRQVTGEYQPCIKQDGKSVPEGEPWPDYFPRVVSQEVFERVTGAAKLRQSPVNKRSTTVANLFGGLCRCEHCGGVMHFERRRVAGRSYHRGRYVLKHDEARLRCAAAYFDRESETPRCDNLATVSYYGFEKAVLDVALRYALDDQSFVQTDELARLNAALAETRRARENAMTKARSFWEAWARAQSPALENLARENDRAVEEADEAIRELEDAAAKASGQADAEEHLSRIAEVRSHLHDDDLDVRQIHRTKVAQGFRAIVERIDFDRERGGTLRFIAGKRVVRIVGGKLIANYDFDKPLSGGDAHFSDSQRATLRAYRKRVATQPAA